MHLVHKWSKWARTYVLARRRDGMVNVEMQYRTCDKCGLTQTKYVW